MAEHTLVISEAGVRVVDLTIPRKDVADFLRSIPEDEREATFVQALEVGTFCLERTRTSQDTEFVKRQVESLLARVEKAVEGIPDATQEALIARIGTNEGQVLAPVQALVQEASRTTSDRLREVRDLLSQEIDPAKETTTLGKALRALRDLLDPKRTDSVQGAIEAALRSVTAEDGALAKAVQAAAGAAVKPLADEVNRLAKEVRGEEMTAEALQQTTEKGLLYEEEVVGRLQEWSQVSGAEVHRVGTDSWPGDVLVRLAPTSLAPASVTIVLEVRDRQVSMGRKQIADALTVAMAERQAGAAVYVSRTRDGLAKEIGEWAEGECEHGPWVACTDEHLTTALRFTVVRERLAALRAAAPEVNAASIEAQLQRIRTALARVKTINSKVTDVRSSIDDIQGEAVALRDEVRGALTAIEDALKTEPSGQPDEQRLLP